MKLTIDELIKSPFVANDIELSLMQLEHCEFLSQELSQTYIRLLYKGMPYLIRINNPTSKSNSVTYRILGFNWIGGTGSTSDPYYPPSPKIGEYKSIQGVLKHIKRNYAKNICIPQPGKFSNYNNFSLTDNSLWYRLMELMIDSRVNDGNSVSHQIINLYDDIKHHFIYLFNQVTY